MNVMLLMLILIFFCEFTVYEDCSAGICKCVHFIGGAKAKLLPCRAFCELLLRGDNDPDWDYILRCVCFGFKVINSKCKCAYFCTNYSSSTNKNVAGGITKRLSQEISSGALSIVQDKLICTHSIGTVPKASGEGFRVIIDCSSPQGEAVNDNTDNTWEKFSYNSVDNVTDRLQKGDHIATVDITDAYRAVSIHPADAIRQGLSWKFEKEGEPT